MPVHVAEELIKTAGGTFDIDFQITMNIAGSYVCRSGTVNTGNSLAECVALQDENAVFIGTYLDMHIKTGKTYGQALQSYELAIADIDDKRYFNDAAYRNKATENKKWVLSIMNECDTTRKMLNKAKEYGDIQKIAECKNNKTNSKMNKAR